MIQNYINHIALVVDKSGSMQPFASTVVEVFDREIAYLKTRSVELDQETRVSVYLFGSDVECLVFDMDVMRMKSLKGYYQSSGQTALIDGTWESLRDMAELPQKFGDHAFLVYVLTDGEENYSDHTTKELTKSIEGLAENWTVVCMVPNSRGIHEAKKFGFPVQNIQIWDTSERGVEKAGNEFRTAMNTYMTNRSLGVRGTKTFFKTDLSNTSKTEIQNNLEQLKGSEYRILSVTKETPIKDFVESWTGSYLTGSSYYELMKRETIQAYKEICIQNRSNGKVYAGTNARNLLGFPTTELNVSPGDHGDWRIFVQSTSVNRKLLKGTLLLVRS